MKFKSQAYRNGECVCGVSFQHFLGKQEGVFETMRSRAGCISGLDYHIHRIREALGKLGFACPSFERFERGVREIVKATRSEIVIRLVGCREDWYLFADPWVDAWAGKSAVSLLPVGGERERPEIKSCLAPVSIRARSEAEAAGYDEALLVDGLQQVREGAWSNIFYVSHSDTLVTPADRILMGVTRKLIIERAKEICRVVEENFSLQHLLAEAREVFITQATRGIVPVSRIGERRFEHEGKVTAALRAVLAPSDYAS